MVMFGIILSIHHTAHARRQDRAICLALVPYIYICIYDMRMYDARTIYIRTYNNSDPRWTLRHCACASVEIEVAWQLGASFCVCHMPIFFVIVTEGCWPYFWVAGENCRLREEIPQIYDMGMRGGPILVLS